MFVTALDSLSGHLGGVATGSQGGSGGGIRTPVQIPAPRQPVENDVTWPLPHRPEAPAAARHSIETILHDWHVDSETADAAVLVVSELVTNAVEHAQPPLALHVHRERSGSRVWVGVTDGGPAPHDGAWTSSCTADEHGRGMDIVDMLTEAHGTHNHPHGATHWARLTTA